MSPAGQAKLLRFLESGEFYKVGGTKKYVVKTRVVSATNKNIEALVEKEKFRKDLYFRLCVVKANIPSLNDRKEDIIPLAKYFLHEFVGKFDKNITGLSNVAEKRLLSHEFTGNVRELKNIIERSVLVAQNDLLEISEAGIYPESGKGQDRVDAPDTMAQVLSEQGMDLKAHLAGVEKEYMKKALDLAGNNESKAARLLNMNHHTFRYRWKKLK